MIQKKPIFHKAFLHDLVLHMTIVCCKDQVFRSITLPFRLPSPCGPVPSPHVHLPTSPLPLLWAVPTVLQEEFLEGGQIWLQIISLQHTLASENQILFVIWFALPALCHSDGNADGFQACLVEERTRFS